MTTATIATTIKQFTTRRLQDKLAFLVLIAGVADTGYLLAVEALKKPFIGSAVIFAYCLFAYVILSTVWQKMNEADR